MTGTSCLRRGSQVAMIKRHMEHTDISAIHFESHLPHLVKDGRCVTADKTETTVQDGVPPFGIVKLVNILRGHREISWPFLLAAKASKKKNPPDFYLTLTKWFLCLNLARLWTQCCQVEILNIIDQYFLQKALQKAKLDVSPHCSN